MTISQNPHTQYECHPLTVINAPSTTAKGCQISAFVFKSDVGSGLGSGCFPSGIWSGSGLGSGLKEKMCDKKNRWHGAEILGQTAPTKAKFLKLAC